MERERERERGGGGFSSSDHRATTIIVSPEIYLRKTQSAYINWVGVYSIILTRKITAHKTNAQNFTLLFLLLFVHFL